MQLFQDSTTLNPPGLSGTVRFLVGFVVFATIITGGCDSPSSSNDGLPPDPGEAGKATLSGIDSDGDGLRDDVQRYIFTKYDNGAVADDIARVARTHLQTLEVASSEQEVLDRTVDMIHAVQCLYESLDPTSADVALTELETVMLNTRERIEASLRADLQANGNSFVLEDDPSGC